MMENQVNSEGDSCPTESPAASVPAKNYKIGRLKIRTPAEINKKYDEISSAPAPPDQLSVSNSPSTPGSSSDSDSDEDEDVEAALAAKKLVLAQTTNDDSETSSESGSENDKIDAKKQAKAETPKKDADILFSIASQLSPVFSTESQIKVSKPPVEIVKRLREPSNGVIAPKRKSKYRGFDLSKFEYKPAVANLYGPEIQTYPRNSREAQEKMGGNISTQFDVNLGRLQGTTKTPKPVSNNAKQRIMPYPRPTFVSKSFLTPSGNVVHYSAPAPVNAPCPPKSRRGLKGRTAGFGEMGILSPSQDNRLKEHRVSEADARNIAASWKKLKPSIKQTESDVPNERQGGTSAQVPRQNEKLNTISKSTGFNLRRENSVSTSTAFSASISSTDLEAAVENKRPTQAKSVKNKPPVQRSKAKKNYPEFEEVSRMHESSAKKKYPGFGEVLSFQGRNTKKKYPEFGEAANSSDLRVIEKTKYKNMPMVSNETAKLTGFMFYRENDQGASDFASQSKPVSNKSDVPRRFPHGINTGAMKAKMNSPEVSKTANSITLQEKLKSISAIRELNTISRSGEEDWDYSLRQYIPVERYPNKKNKKVRTAHRGFGGVSCSVKSREKKKSSKSEIGGRSHFKKGNPQQRKKGERKGINCSSNSIEIIELTDEDLTEKTDKNSNVNIQEKRESDTLTRNDEEVSTDTDTEDDGREKLLDGVVFSISGYEDPLRGKLVRKAVAMGAHYRTGWTKDCSHLICGFKGSFKYLQAKGRGNIVLGTWIEDCYKSRKKIDWKGYLFSKEQDDQESKEETISPVARLRFLTGMEVLVKESSLVPQLLGEAGFVMGMHQGWVQVLIHGQGQFLLSPRQLEHLPPEVGDKAKYCMEGQGEEVVEVLRVEKERDIAVVRHDGYRGAGVWLKNLCRVYDD